LLLTVDETNYDKIQKIIYDCCEAHPPLYFDVLAWNNDHRSIISDQLNERHSVLKIEKNMKMAKRGLLKKK
jgi:hypothetical protein